MARNRTVRQSVRQRLATKWAEEMVLGQVLATHGPIDCLINSSELPVENFIGKTTRENKDRDQA
jgi:hypothetical protein